MQGNGFNILDRDLKNQIIEYYSNYNSISRFETVYTEVLFKFHEYINPYFDYSQKKVIRPDVTTKTETKNMLVIIQAQLNDGIEAYEEALQSAATLKENLQKHWTFQ